MKIFETEIYRQRREVLKKKVGKGKILFLGNEESGMNYKDNTYHFRQDSTFLYYFGINQPSLAAIIDIDADTTTIFGNELTIDDIIWTGPLPTLVEMASWVGINTTKTPSQLSNDIDRHTHYLPPYRPEHQIKLSNLFSRSIPEIGNGYSLEVIKAISDQRSIKGEEEIAQMHEACSYSGEGHLAMMLYAKPGMREHHLVGIMKKVGMDYNVTNAYPTICTINGQVLHNHHYDNELKEGQIVLIDSGLESPMQYAGDLTRSFPVSQKWTPRQKDIYNVVYSGFMHAIDYAKVGTTFLDLHLETARKMTEGLIDLGIMKGNAQDAVANGAHTLFFPHGLGHLIGLDVHDMENFGEEHIGYTPDLTKSGDFGLKSLRLGKALKEGYAVTIEPGIYMIPELMDKKKADGLHKDFINYDKLESFRSFGGIRLEDDFVMRKNGFEKLGNPLARTAEEIEEIRYQSLS